MGQKIKSFLIPYVSVDLRSLAVMRMGVAAILIGDLINRSRDLSAHYTDFGVLPRAALLEHFMNRWYISFHLMSGSWHVQALLFVVAGGVAVLLFLGWRTRLMTLLSWIFLISLQSRNPMILQGGDVLLRLVLFWGIFLPWGERFSLDRVERETPNNSRISMAGFAYIQQILMLYFFAAVLKSGPEWRVDGTAIYYALSIDPFYMPLTHLIKNYPEMMKWLTFGIFYFELFYPLMLFSPIWPNQWRTFAVVGTVGLHLGLLLHLRLGHFPWIGMFSAIGLLPSWVWQFRPMVRLSNRFEEWFGLLNIHSKNWLKQPQPIPWPWWWGWTGTGLACVFMVYIWLWNLGGARGKSMLPKKTHWVGRTLRLDQKWALFAPAPMKDDGWYVIPGRQLASTNPPVDLMRGGTPVNWEKPEHVNKLYSNYRWRKYHRNIWLKKNRKHRLYYGRYLCRKWNRVHKGQEKINTFKIYYMKEKTLLNDRTAPIKKVLLWSHACFKKRKGI